MHIQRNMKKKYQTKCALKMLTSTQRMQINYVKEKEESLFEILKNEQQKSKIKDGLQQTIESQAFKRPNLSKEGNKETQNKATFAISS
jgi:hypothetical protein